MECDAVVIGAGHNGLTLAGYLQRAGLSTIVVDRSLAAGGQCRTEQPVRRGFLFHPHANFLNYSAIMPMMADLRLATRVRVRFPRVQHGLAFEDGRPGLVLHRADALERTFTSIARYSTVDADTFVQLKQRARRLTPSLARVIYQPPTPTAIAEHLVQVERVYADLGVTSCLGARTAQEVIDEVFVTAEMRTLMYLLVTEFGIRIQETGGDAAFLGIALWMICCRGLPLGGMHTVTDALWQEATLAGVRVLLGVGVDRIVVSSGHARGVRLSDGQVVTAGLVASSADLVQTLLQLVEPGALDAAAADEVAAYQMHSGTTMTAQHFCLAAPPVYRSSRSEPDLNLAAHTFIGLDTPAAVLRNLQAIERGQLPEPGGSVHANTLHDPSQAPAGRASVGVNTAFPAIDTISAMDQDRIAESYNEALLHRWVRYAPNMTPDNVLGHHFGPFHRSDRRIQLRSGHNQYRSPIPGLYLCGASTYPGGGVHGACGYNAFSTIANDLLHSGRADTTASPRAASPTSQLQEPSPQR